MAMMISKFHKLIQSKVVWYIVLGIIVIAFVGFFTPTMGSGGGSRKEPVAGEVFGEKVMLSEYQDAYRNVFLWYTLLRGEVPNADEALAARFREDAWYFVAGLRKANQEGVIISDQEVIREIQQLPVFLNQSGVFDPNVYKAVLNALKIRSARVENLVRSQLALSKLAERASLSALIAPKQLEEAYRLYTDRFVVNYAVLPREEVEKTVNVTIEDAKKIFTENVEAFRMPAKVQVSYVELPVEQYVEQAEVPEGAALQVYNQNLQYYRIENEDPNAPVEYKAFEDVEEEINGEIRRVVARRMAAEEATALVADIAPKAEGETPDFAGAAAAADLAVKRLPAFGPEDPIPGVDSTAPFRQAAFRLQDDVYSSFSDAVVGQDFVYVLSLVKRYPSFLPGFDAVEEQAIQVARNIAVQEALAKRADKLNDELAAAMADGKSFDQLVADLGLSVQKTDEFTAESRPEMDHADSILSVCLNRQEGEFCEPVLMSDGVLLAYVAQRVSDDMTVGLPPLRPRLINALQQYRSRQLFSDFGAELMLDADVKDLTDEL
jgi:hypothetical protein